MLVAHLCFQLNDNNDSIWYICCLFECRLKQRTIDLCDRVVPTRTQAFRTHSEAAETLFKNTSWWRQIFRNSWWFSISVNCECLWAINWKRLETYVKDWKNPAVYGCNVSHCVLYSSPGTAMLQRVCGNARNRGWNLQVVWCLIQHPKTKVNCAFHFVIPH